MSLVLSANTLRSRYFNFAIDLTIESDRVTAIYGASGSGKTTLLRLITGLDHQNGVEVKFNDVVWQNERVFVPAHLRRIGFVFQHLNLFPHLTAAKNLEFAIKRHKKNPDLEHKDIIDMLDLGSLLPKRPENLSGGEQQRVAIARALLSNPQLLVMDEPLGSIDTVAKNRILPYLQRLHDTLKVPMIYVSHALDEVLTLADNVIFLKDGQSIHQQSVFDFSIYGPDADLPQGAAIISCRVSNLDSDNGLIILNFENQTMYLAADSYSLGDVVRVRVPARDVSLTLEKAASSSILNIFEGKISQIHDNMDGPTVVAHIRCGKQNLLARITRKSLSDLGLKIGQRVYAQVKGVALMVNNDH